MNVESSRTLIRAVIALFAAVVGFGLKTFFEPRADMPAEMLEHRWLLFFILLMLVFRLVCGASVHLADLYAQGIDEQKTKRICFDLFALMGFAIALLQVTLAASIEEFFLRLLVPIVAALVWAGVERAIWKHPLGQRFWEINCCYALIILLICFLDHYDLHVIRDPLWHWQASVVFVVAASLTAALFDVHAQMVHVASGGRK